MTLRVWPSAKGRSILKCLVPVGAARSVNVASLQPILNAGVRTRWNSGGATIGARMRSEIKNGAEDVLQRTHRRG
ncbi:hypothetical protein CA830_23475 [Burkholderia multivorans]|nr:hypothetical protein CA830_23475 [Burkholderia multivorans]